MKYLKYCFPLVFLTLAILSSCLSDPIDGPEVRSSQVHGPVSLTAYSSNFQPPNLADMVVHWGHSISDTQLNFAGYFVRVFTSEFDSSLRIDTALTLVRSLLVPKVGNRVDTIVTIPGLPAGRYTIEVNGQQTSDSVVLSIDTSTYSFYLDARPLDNPINLQATSTAAGTVTLHWDLPATDAYGSVLGYLVYYRDSDLTAGQPLDTGQVAFMVGPGINSAAVNPVVPPNANDPNPQQEHKFQFWVKALRSDNQQFYQDSSMVVWSGADRVANDSVRRSILFSAIAGTGATIIDDSVDNAAQIALSFSGSSIVLTAQQGGSFLDRIDRTNSLDSIFYRYPYSDNFTLSTITVTSQQVGAVVYYKFPDALLTNKFDYARVLFVPDSTGSIVTKNRSATVRASWQHATNKSGSDILPYY